LNIDNKVIGKKRGKDEKGGKETGQADCGI
jgi:hypothetical protein